MAKIAVEPGWGHWELFGIGRSFRDRIYPATGSPHNDVGVGRRRRRRLPRAAWPTRRSTIGLKGLWGEGVGRYGSSTIADVTIRPSGELAPLHGFSALGTVEMNPTKRLMLYFNYGGDYIGRDWILQRLRLRRLQRGYVGLSHRACFHGREPQQRPNHSGQLNLCLQGNNKDVQEFTAGYWYNFYAGPKGRLRQGIQYSLIRRDLWSGAQGNSANAAVGGYNPGGGAHGDDNMVFTSFRYYLP